jgi:hypothetical protein
VEENDKAASQSTRLQTQLQAVSAVVAIVALVATAYLSIRAERNKALTLRYLGQRPLLSLQRQPTQPLEVMLRGERLQAPWLLSARIENTGNQPIEAKDIEKPLELSFGSGRIVGAEVVGKRQTAIDTTVRFDERRVTVEHGLLNPGDWVAFDVLFDGEPGARSPSLRVSGVTEVEEETDSFEPTERFSLRPSPIVYFATAITWGVGLILLLIGVARISFAMDAAYRAAFPKSPHPLGFYDRPPRDPREKSAKYLLMNVFVGLGAIMAGASVWLIVSGAWFMLFGG